MTAEWISRIWGPRAMPSRKHVVFVLARDIFHIYIYMYTHTHYLLQAMESMLYCPRAAAMCNYSVVQKKFQTAMLGEQETSGKTVEQDQAQSN